MQGMWPKTPMGRGVLNVNVLGTFMTYKLYLDYYVDVLLLYVCTETIYVESEQYDYKNITFPLLLYYMAVLKCKIAEKFKHKTKNRKGIILFCVFYHVDFVQKR